MPDAAFDMRKLVIPFKHRLTDNAEPFEVLMDKLEREKAAIVRKLILAYKRSRTTTTNSATPKRAKAMTAMCRPRSQPQHQQVSGLLLTACYVRTENDDTTFSPRICTPITRNMPG